MVKYLFEDDFGSNHGQKLYAYNSGPLSIITILELITLFWLGKMKS